MGINLFGSNSSFDESEKKLNSRSVFWRSSNSSFDTTPPNLAPTAPTVRPGNPNPANYDILIQKDFPNFSILLIRYPDCKNYEGNKILVFRKKDVVRMKEQKLIDPHFCDNKKFASPVARFEPTTEGMKMAEFFVQNYYKYPIT